MAFLSGCIRHYDDYLFILGTMRDGKPSRQYSFQFEMDSARVYSTCIATRLDKALLKKDALNFEIELKSPTGKKYSEEVSFPLKRIDGIKVREGVDFVDIEWPYRENVSTDDDAGLWNVMIRVADTAAARSVVGVGFAYK